MQLHAYGHGRVATGEYRPNGPHPAMAAPCIQLCFYFTFRQGSSVPHAILPAGLKLRPRMSAAEALTGVFLASTDAPENSSPINGWLTGPAAAVHETDGAVGRLILKGQWSTWRMHMHGLLPPAARSAHCLGRALNPLNIESPRALLRVFGGPKY